MEDDSVRHCWTVRVAVFVAAALGLVVPSSCRKGFAGDDLRIKQAHRVDPQPQTTEKKEDFIEDDDEYPDIVPAAAWQPPLMPSPRLQPTVPLPPAAAEIARRRSFEASRTTRTTLRARDVTGRSTTDAADILRKTPTATSTGVQRRSPIVNDPRVQGSRVGQLPTVGSYWVPARIDLDTVLSKFDSRVLDELSIIPGPFSASLGPGFHFLESRLRDAPRFDDGLETHAASTLEYQTNGAQWHARQELWSGDEDWGIRAGYSQRHGDDYRAGNGEHIPSGYQSGTGDLAAGFNLDSDSRIDVHYLRVDQRRIDLPGQAFDINSLVTDGVDLVYRNNAPTWGDFLAMEGWYNHTNLSGDTDRPSKRMQFPIFDTFSLSGHTNVDSMSTGARLATTWGESGQLQSTLGASATHVRQELNEFVTYKTNLSFAGNSPIPRSGQTDVGLFWETVNPVSDRVDVHIGSRVDFVDSEVLAAQSEIMNLHTITMPSVPNEYDSLAQLLGSSDFHQTFFPWLAYLTADFAVTEEWTLTAGVGHGERPPSLTELYAAAPFMFLIQNGLNTITGDPRLRPEKMTQLQLALRVDGERNRGRIRAFHAWVNDAITFEAAGLFSIPGQADQVQLRYVNTDLATLSGAEAFGEYDLSEWWTPFASIAYTQGTDLARNGHFSTFLAQPGVDQTQRIPGEKRGDRGTAIGSGHEPLPGILPLESRIGVRWHSPGPMPKWSIELLARVVADQDRVARSLLESTTPGFTTWHVRGRWQATRNCLLFAGVENFTNKHYREHLDFRPVGPGFSVFQPGASFFAGTDLTW